MISKELIDKLTIIAKDNQIKNDPAHDFEHVTRVLNNCILISKEEIMADLDILIPAALFHDIVLYPKNTPKSSLSTDDSAKFILNILNNEEEYPTHKIKDVCQCIEECSFSKNKIGSTLESRILQDADMLEATGAIAIMRTFASGGLLNVPFYPKSDPLCKNTAVKFRSCLDIFPQRLLLIKSRMNTKTGKEIATSRHEFLLAFLDSLSKELSESGII